MADLAERQPDVLARVPLVAYQNSTGQWDALPVDPKDTFAGFPCIAASLHS